MLFPCVTNLLPKVRFGTAADERIKSAMLGGACAAYERKENIISTAICVRC